MQKDYTASSFKKVSQFYKNTWPADVKIGEINVDAIRIDDYCKENGITEIFLLKVDVEGMSYEVLEGCGDMLKKVQWIGVEIDKCELFENDASGELLVEKILLANNFRKFADVYAHYSPVSGKIVLVDSLWENTKFKIIDNDFYHLNGENSIFKILAPYD